MEEPIGERDGFDLLREVQLLDPQPQQLVSLAGYQQKNLTLENS